MVIKVGSLKRLGNTNTYNGPDGYSMTLHQNGAIGARSPYCDYVELEDRTSDIREAKRLYVAWANRQARGLD